MKKEYYETISPENAAFVLVDHQIGLYTGIRDIPVDEVKHNIIGLVKAVKIFKLPIVVTTTTENMWGPMIPELQELLNDYPVIERTTVNAWDDSRVLRAIENAGRRKLIMTGISTDVCLAFPAITAVGKGYDVYGVIDASGAFTVMQRELAVARMVQAGVKVHEEISTDYGNTLAIQ